MLKVRPQTSSSSRSVDQPLTSLAVDGPTAGNSQVFCRYTLRVCLQLFSIYRNCLNCLKSIRQSQAPVCTNTALMQMSFPVLTFTRTVCCLLFKVHRVRLSRAVGQRFHTVWLISVFDLSWDDNLLPDSNSCSPQTCSLLALWDWAAGRYQSLMHRYSFTMTRPVSSCFSVL